jgi:hypothetical protein
MMATVHRLPRRELFQETLPMRLVHLLKLELELGLAEARDLVVSAAISIAMALVSTVALIASLVVLVTGAVAPLFGMGWPPFIIAGGGMALLAVITILWSAWRLRRLDWPHETLTSVQENWRWLAAQLRSKLTLR